MPAIKNIPLAKFIASHGNGGWLAYMINNNKKAVMEFLHARTDLEIHLDSNNDGDVSPRELYEGLVAYFKQQGGFDEFVNDMKKRVMHNPAAPAKWNLFK